MGTGSLRRAHPRRALSLLLAFSLLASGCVTAEQSGESFEEGTVVERGGVFGRLLPKPLGTVSCEEEPLVYALGWTGMIAGGIAGGAIYVIAIDRNRVSGSGEAVFPALLLCIAMGAAVGGVALTLPVRGIEALIELLFGSGEETAPP